MKIFDNFLGKFYLATVIVLLGASCKKSTPEPVAGFTYSNPSPLTVVFTNNSSNASEYIWDFGDKMNSREINPTHIYQSFGNYTVKLQASSDGVTKYAQQAVALLPKSVKINYLVLDSIAELSSPMTLYFTFSGGSTPYISSTQTWSSGNPIATWAMNSNYSVPVDTPIDIKVLWTMQVQTSLLGTVRFDPKTYMIGPNTYPATVSLRYLSGISEMKVTLSLQWL